MGRPVAASITLAAVCLSTACAFAGTVPNFVITNDNVKGANTVTLYQAAGTQGAPTLTLYATLKTGGTGLGGGFYAEESVLLVPDGNKECAFAADAGSNDIAGIKLSFHPVVTGNFTGSKTDSGSLGIGLATKGQKFLYAAFTGSRTIATFSIQPGCVLNFVGDVPAAGLRGGPVNGMKVSREIMVVAYGDGSIQSFNITQGTPVANSDLQTSQGYHDYYGAPTGVDITADGLFAIFGDSGAWVTVEVSNLSGGKLAPTIVFGGPHGILGDGADSSNVYLSPDQTLLYIGLNYSGVLAAAKFDRSTGAVSAGCRSAQLIGFGTTFDYTAGIALGSNTGTGSPLYIGETPGGIDSPPSSIGIVNLTENGGNCTMTESTGSPASDPASAALLSLSSYPPRAF
jgi:hypothetical protein